MGEDHKAGKPRGFLALALMGAFHKQHLYRLKIKKQKEKGKGL